MATGLEALIGYLALSDREQRLDDLMTRILEDEDHETKT
jgi:23S rRNA maturation mini-RNase III